MKITTAKEIEKLVPGKEMDALVQRILYPERGTFYISEWSIDLVLAWGILDQFPRYTISKAASSDNKDEYYRVTLGENQYSGETGLSDSSLPMAICKSALLRKLKYEKELVVTQEER